MPKKILSGVLRLLVQLALSRRDVVVELILDGLEAVDVGEWLRARIAHYLDDDAEREAVARVAEPLIREALLAAEGWALTTETEVDDRVVEILQDVVLGALDDALDEAEAV